MSAVRVMLATARPRGSGLLFEIDGDGRIRLQEPSALPREGSYTTLRTYDGRRVLGLDRHLARLNESAVARGPLAALDEQRWRGGLRAALAAAALPEARVRATFAPPRLLLAVEPFEPLPPALYAEGVRCASVALRRERPRVKDVRFREAADGARAALPAWAHEGLMFEQHDGALLEGLSSNFFACLGGCLRTEEARVLPGVTRSLVLELAERRLPVERRPVHRTELPDVSEAFITSVSRGVLPVVAIDDQVLGDGRPGGLTRALGAALADLAQREAREP